MQTENLFKLPSLPPDRELITVLAEREGMRVERIVSTGQTSGWYDQEESEFVSLLQGNASLEWVDGTTTRLSAGDTLTIPPGTRHRVSSTSSEPPCVWLCVFF